MASLSASLSLDVRKFEEGLRTAKVELQTFERAAGAMNRDLKRLLESFSGEKVVIEASRMAEAVERLGGVSKLTEAEQRRVNAAVSEAVSKYRALGQEAPPHLVALQQATARTEVSTSALASTVGRLASGFAIGAIVDRGVSALGSFVKTSFESAGAVADLADKTGLSTESIQRMQFVAGQTGTTVDAFTSAAFRLGVKLDGGGASVRAAMDALGLSFDTIRALSPDQQFDAITAALGRMDDPQTRNRVGVELFGKAFAEIAPAVAAGYADMANAAAVSSDQQIRALDAAGDALDAWKSRVQTGITSVAGTIALWADDTVAAFDLMINGTGRFTAQQQEMINFLRGQGGEGLAAYLRQIQAGTAATKEAVQPVVDYNTALINAYEEVNQLTAAQLQQIESAQKLGVSTAEIAATFNISEAALRLLNASLQESQRRMDAAAASSEKLRGAGVVLGDVSNVLRFQLAGILNPALLDLQTNTKNADQAVQALRDDLARLGGEATTIAPILRSISMPGLDRSSTFNGSGLGMLRGSVEPNNPSAGGGGIGGFFRGLFGGGGSGGSGGGSGGGGIGGFFRGLFGGGGGGGGSASGGAGGFFSQLAGGAKQAASSITSTFQAAFIGGGGAMGAVKAFATQGLSKLLGMIPGVGPFVSGFAGPIVSMFGKLGNLFGGQAKKVAGMRDEWLKAGGGIDALSAKAQAAGVTLDRVLRAKTVKEYEAAVRELDEAFKRLEENRNSAVDLFEQILQLGSAGIPAAFQPAIDQLIALGLLTDEQVQKLRDLGSAGINVDQMTRDIELFGGRIDSLGPGFRQAQIDKTAGEYINAIDRLIRGGADVGGVLFDAREEISKLVQDSLEFGTTLPANMQPWIEELARSGNLVDKNGQKITDVSKLKFGDPIKTEAQRAEDGWKKILDAIQALIDRINGPLMNAIDGIPTNKTINVGIQYSDPGAPTGGGNPAGGYATGTMGVHGQYFKNFGRGTATTLHGTEAVITPDQAPAFAAAVLKTSMRPSRSAGATTIRVPVYIDGRQIATATAPYLPGALRTYGV